MNNVTNERPAVAGANDKAAIVELWNDHWSTERQTTRGIVESRFAQEAFRVLLDFVPESASNILEIGCGTGRLCALLAQARPGASVTGADLSESSLAIANHVKNDLGLQNLEFVKADLFKLPYPDNAFDVVFGEGVIQHFRPGGQPAREAALKEQIRVTRPGGSVVVGVVNWHCYPHTFYKWLLERRGVPYEYGYEQSFSRRELAALLREHGLTDIEARAYYPAHGLIRFAQYWRPLGRMGRMLDRVKARWFVDRFGFELTAVGTKRS